MNLKKYMVLLIGCGLSFILTIGAVVVLVQKVASNGRADADLKAAAQKLKQLDRRSVYPSLVNLQNSQSNLATLSTALSNASTRLRVGQIPDGKNVGEFAQMVEDVVKKLKATAVSSAVTLPADFGFGFDRYLKGGIRPDAASVPRLAVQLRITDALCAILYEAKVSNVTVIAREEFESNLSKSSESTSGGASLFPGRSESRSGTTTSKDISTPASNELYTVERFRIEFYGRENSVWEVLNNLAKGPPYAVIRDAQVEASLPGFGAAGTRSLPLIGSSASLPLSEGAHGRGGGGVLSSPGTNLLSTVEREDRIVAGRETVKAALVVDVYRFMDAQGDGR